MKASFSSYLVLLLLACHAAISESQPQEQTRLNLRRGGKRKRVARRSSAHPRRRIKTVDEDGSNIPLNTVKLALSDLMKLSKDIVKKQPELLEIHHGNGAGIARFTQDVFVQECLNTLEGVSDNGQVTPEAYLEFLQSLSKGRVKTRKFKDLSFFLSTIFFSASCSTGRDCVSELPVILLDDLDVNVVLCRQLMLFPFVEVEVPFQFLIRVSNNVTADDIISQGVQAPVRNPIATSLEHAINQVLLQGFDCPYDPLSEKGRSSKRRQIRQPQPQNDCDVVVQASINGAADYPCSGEESCIVIFSDVQINSVVKDNFDEPELRDRTTNLLRDAINGDILEGLLPDI